MGYGEAFEHILDFSFGSFQVSQRGETLLLAHQAGARWDLRFFLHAADALSALISLILVLVDVAGDLAEILMVVCGI